MGTLGATWNFNLIISIEGTAGNTIADYGFELL